MGKRRTILYKIRANQALQSTQQELSGSLPAISNPLTKQLPLLLYFCCWKLPITLHSIWGIWFKRLDKRLFNFFPYTHPPLLHITLTLFYYIIFNQYFYFCLNICASINRKDFYETKVIYIFKISKFYNFLHIGELKIMIMVKMMKRQIL